MIADPQHRPPARRPACPLVLAILAILAVPGCSRPASQTPVTITFPGSAVGAEAQILRRQLATFMVEHPGIRVVQRRTPDAADQRHQLYVQWLNAGAGDPDILQLDVIWTPEFAAAGWILPLDRFSPDTAAFFAATIAANRWRDTLYAVPWFVDVGMLYWRTDLMPAAPATLAGLERIARAGVRSGRTRYGLVWQGARYEGLITTFVEYLAAYGGRILDGGRVVVNSPAGLAALAAMRDEIYRDSIVPPGVLTWHEEETRFAFQNGEAAFMRNWPYAYSLMQDTAGSKVAGSFAVAPMPAGPGGAPSAALGGSQLAINRNCEFPDSAWQVIAWLTAPSRMLERAEAVGQFPARQAVYDDPRLVRALAIPPADARAIIAHAVPRPVTPVYTQLSGILQIQIHRALTRQTEPRAALDAAAREMQALLDRVGLGGEAGTAGTAGTTKDGQGRPG
ncbi:MAG: ABC transporter substrate-binding protein [Gemmatimonadales bacterium]